MILLKLYWEFFKTGLFAIGGGMATLPFLKNIGETTGWYTYADLMNMLAVSESTPGPIGINMATYVGFSVAGVPGALSATLGEVTPSIAIILLVAAFLKNFRNSPWVNRAFYGLRPASTGLIGAACVSVFLEVFSSLRIGGETFIQHLSVTGEPLFYGNRLILGAVLLAGTNLLPKARNWHPVIWIAISAAAGIAFHFAV